MSKPKSKLFQKLPSNYSSELFVYTSRIIFEKCDVNREYVRLLEAGKLDNDTSLDTFRLNMALMINYLTHNINENTITNLSRDKFIKTSNTKLYRVCIDVLKKGKILFICSHKGVESYRVDCYSKGYKFNITQYGLSGDTPVKIKVNDHRVIKKVIKNVNQLQVSKHLIEHFTKFNTVLNPYKSNSFMKKAKSMAQHFKNALCLKKCMNVAIYIHEKVAKKKDNVKKNYMIHLLSKSTAYFINRKYMNVLSSSQIRDLKNKLSHEWANYGQRNARAVAKQINTTSGYHDLINYDPHFTKK